MNYNFDNIPSRRYDAGGSLSAVGSGITQIAQFTSNLAQTRDTSDVEDAINEVGATQFDESGYDNLLAGWDSVRRLKTNYTAKDVRGLTKGQQFGNIFAATNAGAGAGMKAGSVAGPYGAAIGAVVGGIAGNVAGFIGLSKGRKAARKKARELNKAATEANQNVINNFGYSTNKVAQRNYEKAQANFVAEGGPLLHRYKIANGGEGGSGFMNSGFGKMLSNFMNSSSGSSASGGASGDGGPSYTAILQQAAKVGTAQGAALAAYSKPKKALNPYTGGVSRKAIEPELESSGDKFKRKMGLVTGLVAPIFDVGGDSTQIKAPDTTGQIKNSAFGGYMTDLRPLSSLKTTSIKPSKSKTYGTGASLVKQSAPTSSGTGSSLYALGGTPNRRAHGAKPIAEFRSSQEYIEGEEYDLTPKEIEGMIKLGYQVEYV